MGTTANRPGQEEGGGRALKEERIVIVRILVSGNGSKVGIGCLGGSAVWRRGTLGSCPTELGRESLGQDEKRSNRTRKTACLRPASEHDSRRRRGGRDDDGD